MGKQYIFYVLDFGLTLHRLHNTEVKMHCGSACRRSSVRAEYVLCLWHGLDTTPLNLYVSVTRMRRRQASPHASVPQSRSRHHA